MSNKPLGRGTGPPVCRLHALPQCQKAGSIDTAIDAASGHPGLGILVSRHDRQTLTVELSEEAPCRTIVERDLGTPTPEETCLSFSRHRVLEPHFSLS